MEGVGPEGPEERTGHQVFAVNGDHYVGEWKDNMKHGKWEALGGSGDECGVWAMVDHWGQGNSLQSSLGTQIHR